MTRLLPFCAALLGLLAACPGHAQPHSYRFSLQAEKLDVPAGPWRVMRVLDLRPDRSRLGAVHRGLNNELTSADFVQPLAPELLHFMRAQLPGAVAARPVLLRVFALTIAEDIRPTGEQAEAELVADFLEPLPDSTFRVVLTVGETTRHSGIDVTKRHAANIAEVLQQALRQLELRPTIATSGPEILSQAQALAGQGGATSHRFAIQTDSEPKRGFYRSFQEFRDNTPTEPEYPFAIEHFVHAGKRWAGTDELLLNYLATDELHPTRPVGTSGLWGVCDGRDMLIVYRNRFYQLLPAADGHSYTFVGPPVYDAATASNVGGAAAIGGVLGGAVGGIVAGAIAGAASGANVMVPYELHLASGRIVPVQNAGQTDANGFSTQVDSAIVHLYRRPDAAASQPLTVLLAGKPVATLAPGQYLRLGWTDRQHELALCVQLPGTTATCQSFVPDFSVVTYLECRVPAAGKAVVMKPATVKEGQWQVKRMKPAAD